MTQTIDIKTVQYIAGLSRLGITEEEAQKFSEQFSSIIDYFNMLNEVDTENIPPAYLSSANQSVTREDEIEESVPTNEFLANTPQTKDDLVQIPRVHIEQ